VRSTGSEYVAGVRIVPRWVSRSREFLGAGSLW
jgi:hypothetical protein